MTLNDILSRLEGVKGRDGKYMARCPNHGDTTPSLSVSLGEDGRTILHCFAGCSTEDVALSMGLAMKDLFAEANPGEVFPVYGETKAYQPATQEAEYIYAGGDLKKVKYRRADGSKYCAWYRSEGGAWVKGREGIAPGLYQSSQELPQIFFLVEGEKDVDNLKKAGMVAVSLPDGSQSKWEPSYGQTFIGKQVVILPDNDDAGRKYAEMCARHLHGKASDIWIVDLKGVWSEIPEKGDISDLMGHFGAEAALQRVMEMLKKTPKWEPKPEPADKTKPALVRACDVPYEPPRWLIAPYFQRGKGTMIQGDNGTGKTAFACAVAAHVSTGKPMLDIPITGPGDVLILSVEDDLPVLRGRIDASGGDLSKCHFMTNAAGLTFNSPEVEQAIQSIKAQMVIFDPFQAFMGAGVDMFRSNETRPELAKLFEMCERNNCACIIIAHTVKSVGDKSPVNRSLGSVDIPAAMRSIMQLVRNPDNEDECIMVHVKCSNAPKGRSIAYTIGERGGVRWSGYSPMTVEDLTVISKRKEKNIPYGREPLVQVFNQLVTDRPGGGFWSYADVKSIGAKLLGFPPFYSTKDLKDKLSGPLVRELQERDGLIVTCGCKSNGDRGIRIEQYKVPQGYQTKLDAE